MRPQNKINRECKGKQHIEISENFGRFRARGLVLGTCPTSQRSPTVALHSGSGGLCRGIGGRIYAVIIACFFRDSFLDVGIAILGLPKTTRVCVDSSDIKMLKRLWVAGGRALASHGLAFQLDGPYLSRFCFNSRPLTRAPFVNFSTQACFLFSG